jgi:uncharacterized phage protein (TIGR01671 family)
MKELKFRAWDRRERKFWYFNGIFNERPWKETSTFSQYESIKKYADLEEPQQYTGLKDKNGKEIYEHDIIEWNNERWLVRWGEYGWEIFRQDIYDNPLSYDFEITSFNLIGNIYENPELIATGREIEA